VAEIEPAAVGEPLALLLPRALLVRPEVIVTGRAGMESLIARRHTCTKLITVGPFMLDPTRCIDCEP
jgi:hypothetical protein